MNLERIQRSTLLLLVIGALAACSCLVHAEDDHEARKNRYSQASICGDYGAIATYGANVARALGTEVFDGHGHLTGFALVNQPASSTARSLTHIALAGTYSVHPDGTGKMQLTITLPDGTTPTVTEDFVITKSKSINGVEIASEIQDAQETPSAVIDDASLVIHTYTLRSSPKTCASHP